MQNEIRIEARPPMTVGRVINSLCYLASGVILIGLLLTFGTGSGAWYIWLIALASLAYGAYIGLTRGSYWVSTYTYALPFLAVMFGWFTISMK